MIEISFTDGVTTIALNSGGWRVMEFELQTPEVKASDTEDPTMAGGERFQMTWRNIDQVIEVIYTGGLSEFLTTVSALEQLFGRAAERQSNPGLPRVYIQRKLHSGEAYYRSEIIHGRVMYDQGLLHYPRWPNRAIHLYIGIRRRYYWEAVDEIQLGLSSQGVAKTTNPIVIYNHTDAGHATYVDVDAADVQGTLPAPPRIVMIEQLAGAQWFGRFWIGRNVNASPSTFNHVLEAEDCQVAYQTIVPAVPDYDTYSNGYGNQRSIPAAEGTIMAWDLSSAWLAAAKSQYFHVLAKINSSISTSYKPYVFLRLKILLHTLWTGPKMYPTTAIEWLDLGVVQLPPWLAEVAQPSPLTLELVGGSDTGQAQSIIWDFLSFIPTDSWLYLRQIGYALTQNEQIIYDGYLDQVYGWDPANGSNYSIWSREGGQMYLHPNKQNRFYFHWSDSYHGTRLSGVWAVQMYYRPRRLTL